MKISVIYGTEPNDFMYTQVHLLLEKLNINIKTVVSEFFISRDLPERKSIDWYSFFQDEIMDSEYKRALDKISYSLSKSDLIILASSKYSKDTIIEMKNLLNHLSYEWMPHRRNKTMSNKVAIALSDSSCFAFNLTNKALSKNLRFWGINKECIFEKTFISNPHSHIFVNDIEKNDNDISDFAVKIINQYKRSYKIITPNFGSNSHKTTTRNLTNKKSHKNCSTKKAPLISKCFSSLKKVVHA